MPQKTAGSSRTYCNATENRVRRNLTASNSTQESLRGRFNLKTYGSQWKYKKTGQTQ